MNIIYINYYNLFLNILLYKFSIQYMLRQFKVQYIYIYLVVALIVHLWLPVFY